MKRPVILALVLCLPALLLLPGVSHAAADTDFVSRLVTEFYNKTSAW